MLATLPLVSVQGPGHMTVMDGINILFMALYWGRLLVRKDSLAFPLAVPFWLIGAVMLLGPALSRWLERPGPWKVTIYLNSIIMTLFLWHMTAYFVVLLVLWPIGVGHQQDSTAAWWLLRPVFIGLSALVLAGIVALVGRFERPRPRSAPT